MGAFAALIVAVGIVVVIYGSVQKFKASRLTKAPRVSTGDAAARGSQVAGEKGIISAQGVVKCDAPLTAPASGQACLYYELKVVGSWKEGDRSRSRDYVSETAAADFGIDDGSGPVAIVATKGGSFDLDKTFDETKKEGLFADLKNAVGNKEPIAFGRYLFDNPAMSKANTFRCVEKILPLSETLFACGKSEGDAIVAPGLKSLILSAKSYEELLGDTAAGAKKALVGGGVAIAVGVILGIVSSLVG
ncbi:MAG: hypothetical protein GXP55_02080 [Deltaproteobacteria bacterium]|nr:hypothetical protein [Deltaproteobacteria bacterium]